MTIGHQSSSTSKHGPVFWAKAADSLTSRILSNIRVSGGLMSADLYASWEVRFKAQLIADEAGVGDCLPHEFV
jgi:hypothetical protein